MNLEVKIGNLILKNPITVASGTYGYGTEYVDLYPPSRLGGIFLKGITPEEREGNAPPRLVETASGMLNSIGLQNVGLKRFISEKIPALAGLDGTFFANISGRCVEEYAEIAKALNSEKIISGLEINVSCPNVKEGGAAFGSSGELIKRIAREVKSVYNGCVIMKLSPNVSDVVAMACAAEEGGADALCVANTFIGAAIDINKRRFKLGNKIGGLSGPAIKPIIVRMVYQVSRAVKIPVIGCGGILKSEDVIEFLLAGASAVSIGTANFRDPFAALRALDGLEKYMISNGFDSPSEIRNALIED